MTRGINLRGHSPDRYRREVREPMTRITAYLPAGVPWTSAGIRAVLARVMEAHAEIGDIPYTPAPATRTGLTRLFPRITAGQRGMLELIARLRGVSLSEALRGVLTAWMEGQDD